MFLSSEPFPDDDFSKIFFYGIWIGHGTSLYAKFHDHGLNSLEESQQNHRSGHMRASLTPLNNLKE